MFLCVLLFVDFVDIDFCICIACQFGVWVAIDHNNVNGWSFTQGCPMVDELRHKHCFASVGGSAHHHGKVFTELS